MGPEIFFSRKRRNGEADASGNVIVSHLSGSLVGPAALWRSRKMQRSM